MQSSFSGQTGPDSQLGRKIQRLIDEQLFSIVYQPIIDMRTQQIVAFEALTRPHLDSNFESPAALFEAAEAEAMLWELEGATRRAAMAGAREWPEHVQLFINCAPCVAEHEDFEKQLIGELESTCARYPAQLVVEITERSPHLDMTVLPARIDALRQRGLQIAIDDVGIGASGLVRISSLRPGWLKLDRALIGGIDRDRFRLNLVRHLVRFARACGVQVIAEGIERTEELDVCRDLGVCFGQGFLLGRPTAGPMGLLAECPPPQPTRNAGAAHDALPESVTLLRGVQPAMCVDHSTAVASAAQDLLRDPSLPGLCVTRGDELLGWVRREDALREARTDDRSAMPVSFLARRAPVTESDSLDFCEIFELAATHAQFGADLPIIVLAAGQPQALLTTPTLLSMAADMVRTQASREHAKSAGNATTLPGSSGCLQHLDSLLASTGPHQHDAVVVELVGIGRFNHEQGYDAGERVVTRLRDQLRRARPDGFIGHLGLEVYLLTVPSGTAPAAIRDLLARFEVANASEPGAASVGLRAVEVARIEARFETGKQVLEFASQRRAGAPNERSTVLDDQDQQARSA